MGTIFSSNVFYCEDLTSLISQLRITKPDLNVIGLEQAGNSVSVYSGEYNKKFDVLVLGSEKAGTEKSVLDLCTKIVEIPLDRSALNSLNVNAALSAFLAVCEV
jgi:tRNA G18 (ribose-2'-O)-methylase SpoU